MLELIDLDIESLGYSRFISAWLYRGEEGAFLVDPGPACTTDTLLSALDQKGVDRLDWILLTHIHLDHAGGVGHVSRRFPEARIACHEKAVHHLVDPSRLWAGTRKVLGQIADVYGPVEPVDPQRIRVVEEVPLGGGIRVIPTPGHAPHHQCFVFSDWLFCGELLGVFHDLDGDIYLRPATPPRFVFEAFMASMDRVEPQVNRAVCFGHYGMHPDGARIFEQARTQLRTWCDVVGSHAANPDIAAIAADLKSNDPLFAGLDGLPDRIREREAYYVGNSIRGMLQYVQESRTV